MPFKPGQSGNPAGRKPGTKNRKLELLRSHDAKLQKKVLDMALKGDPAALKIVADRLWPRLRAQAPPVSIDAKSDDLVATGKRVIDAALSGQITTDLLRDLLGALYLQGQITELTEFERRLRELEERAGDTPPWAAPEPSEKLPIRGRKRRRERESTD
jgi:hypothetical protein